MKNILSVIVVGVLVLSGCSSKSAPKSVTCTMKSGEGNLSYKFGYNDKKIVTKMGVEMSTTVQEAISDEQLKQNEDQYKELLDGIKGVDFSVKVSKDKKKITQAINVEFSKYDVEKDELGMVKGISDENGKSLDKSNVKDVIKTFKTSGLTCGKVE